MSNLYRNIVLDRALAIIKMRYNAAVSTGIDGASAWFAMQDEKDEAYAEYDKSEVVK